MNKLSRYRKLRYNQLFESENRELRLNEMGNPLEVLSQYVDFEIFRPTLESALFTGERKSNVGRPPIDCVLMFKVLFLQRYYGLSDHQIEYQIVDCTSFRKFLYWSTSCDISKRFFEIVFHFIIASSPKPVVFLD